MVEVRVRGRGRGEVGGELTYYIIASGNIGRCSSRVNQQAALD